jgi:hypothetical protein
LFDVVAWIDVVSLADVDSPPDVSFSRQRLLYPEHCQRKLGKQTR